MFDDKWYEDHGVAPPTRFPHGTQEELDAHFSKPVIHGKWTQHGTLLTCHKCPNPHSDHIPVDYILQGTDNKGLPILKKLDIHKS